MMTREERKASMPKTLTQLMREADISPTKGAQWFNGVQDLEREERERLLPALEKALANIEALINRVIGELKAKEVPND